MHGGVFVDRERLMSKSDDSFPLRVQTWEFCGGVFLVGGRQGRDLNCGRRLFGGNKRLDQLIYRMIETCKERRNQGRGYTN